MSNTYNRKNEGKHGVIFLIIIYYPDSLCLSKQREDFEQPVTHKKLEYTAESKERI